MFDEVLLHLFEVVCKYVIQGANDVLRRMLQNQSIEPNVTTYNAVINAYANKGHWQVGFSY